MKKNIFYLVLLLFFTFIFTVFYKGLDKPNFYTPKEVSNKNFEEFTSFELFSNKQFDSQDIIENNDYYSEADLNNDDSVDLLDIDFITNLIMSGN